MDDSSIQMVMSVTNTTPELADQYLTLADGDAEQAITLFFENGGADLASNIPEPARAPASSSRPSGLSRAAGREDDDGRIVIDDDDKIPEEIPTTNNRSTTSNSRSTSAQIGGTFNDDAAMAARLQQEMYSGADASGDYDDDGIRAPIARQAQTLVGPAASDELSFGPDAIARQMEMLHNRTAAGRRPGRPGIFNQREVSESIWDEDDSSRQRDILARSTGGASNQSSKSQALAQLFRPPYELMFKMGFEEARDEGRNKSKWLLVDIHDHSVFDCQALNRDIWKHAGIADTVRENFIFMQYDKNDLRATQYLQYYFQDYEDDSKYPHIAILDPRTGEQVKVWSGGPVMKPADFLMQLHEFLDRYSLDAHARNPVARRKVEPKKEKQVSEMTEEEQLEMAMQASLAAGGSNGAESKSQDPDELTRSISESDKGKGKGKGKAVISAEDDAVMTDQTESGGSNDSVTETSPFAKIASDRPHEEPPATPEATRIAFRHPSGRIIRMFAMNDPVRRIYEWLKASPLEGKEGIDFDLVCSGKNLLDSLESTIEEAGLKNATVMVEFLGD